MLTEMLRNEPCTYPKNNFGSYTPVVLNYC